MDKEIFADDIEEIAEKRERQRREKLRQEKEEMYRKNKERQSYLVDKERNQRREDFQNRVKLNSAVFNSSTDSDTENKQIKRRKKQEKEKRKRVESKIISGSESDGTY